MKVVAVDFAKTRKIELVSVVIVDEQKIKELKTIKLRHARKLGSKRRKSYARRAERVVEKAKRIADAVVKVFLNKEKARSFVTSEIRSGDLVIVDDSIFEYFSRNLKGYRVKVMRESQANKQKELLIVCNLADTAIRAELRKLRL